MRRVIHKWFWLWNFDKEEKWLNDMAAKGLILAAVGFTRYEFEDYGPSAYQIRLEMLKKPPNHPESQRYIRFLEETGVEHVGSLFSWVYFRKKSCDTPFDLFSDIDSRIRHLNRILLLPGIFGIVNLINSANWAIRYISSGDNGDLFVSLFCGAAALLLAYGYVQLLRKKLRLQKERVLHE